VSMCLDVAAAQPLCLEPMDKLHQLLLIESSFLPTAIKVEVTRQVSTLQRPLPSEENRILSPC